MIAIATKSITVHCGRLASGYFFLWAETEKGRTVDLLELKAQLFAWHSLSFYGTILETIEMDHKHGVLLSSAMALDYLASPKPLLHAKLDWSEDIVLLQQTAEIYKAALTNGWFAPHYEKWKTGALGWKLMLPEEIRRKYEAVSKKAAKSGIFYLEDWFDHIVASCIQEDNDVGETWSKVMEANPLLSLNNGGKQLMEVEAARHGWDEEEWWIAIGWKKDNTPFRTALQLIEPEDEPVWHFRIILQDKEEPDSLVECGIQGEVIQGRLPESWKEHVPIQISKHVRRWTQHIPLLENTDSPGHMIEQLTYDQAWEFLAEGSLRLAEAGCTVLLPAWWESVRQLKPRLKAKVKSSVGSARNSMFGLQQIVQFDWKLAVGELQLSEEEFQRLVEQKRRLIQIQGKWIQLDPAYLEQIQQMMKKVEKKKGFSFRDVLEMHLLGAESESAASSSPDTSSQDASALQMEVELNAHLAQMMDQLQHTSSVSMIQPPDTLQGTLRKYQLQGVSWLLFLRRFGLGGCLADDMGLGKTIQWITYLLSIKETEKLDAPALLICPTSVLGNWQKELQRFAPSLQVHLHYGPQRSKGEDFLGSIQGADLVITSYTLAHMDESELSSVQWSSLCLDEAQNIKNAYTKQSSSIRRFEAGHRIALTGTPIENRLTELWSIFDFVNPGYLGGLSEFNHRFVNEIEKTNDPLLIAQIQKLIGPFLLRRVKKDPAIQLDLPEKNEAKCYVSLTSEQSSLYENIVQDVLHKIDNLTGMERKGLILATLTKLKQLCNHPALLLKEADSARWENRSNKIARLIEMVQEVREEGERCLIFTQFVEMGHRLQAIIEKERGEPVQFLHGGVSKSRRDQMIAHFQDRSLPPDKQCSIFILSLKAGGIGLNLTAANHVFHYDRWWNPAVENQATDRAFRIGQTRDVQVHKFVTLGTLEERIDEMIERKQGLSRQIVGAGENWITELSTNELRDLFALRKTWIAN